MKRRTLLHSSAALGLLGLGACAATPRMPDKARVVVVGGGFGGATAAKYVRLLSDHKIDVVLIEPNEAFVSCPLSNLVVGGSRQMPEITTPYTGLSRRHGITVVRDSATRLDTAARRVHLAGGGSIGYDKLVVSPGIDLLLDRVEGLAAAHQQGRVLHAWKAGPETVQLRRQLEALPDGGVFAITIPEQPYRCPPGPYERACQVAWYFKQRKPRSKVLVLDANPDVTSKGALFKRAWAELYPGMVEYRPQHALEAVDARTGTLKFAVNDDVKAGVLNVLPPMRAGSFAVQAGLNNLANNRWCGVNYLTFESTVHRDVHVLGDSIQIAPGMPKSGHMANNHGKVAAAAIVAQLAGLPPNPAPMLTNTCYSFVDDQRVMHVASVHGWDAADRTFKTVPGSGGLSPAASELEGTYALSWARNIWADMLA
ncbi:NAD(P)/FAD-dependent oxidoreductase [Ramlibacter rhizophilus]|uniref:Flavocytochrome C n=1 Tax=Ramlibacter rhizophilus TaxID=1781167 RepID=A0A4Z0C1H9_9BURK|nr:NAD(P)/FAD-dependent oxidoreductase [Ramlibacter rhizophilus]TFZ04360.1 flavocytochrome C [Ramlibacter rhizophilus]